MRPPLLLIAAFMALCAALVSSARPSPFAPNCRTFKTLPLETGPAPKGRCRSAVPDVCAKSAPAPSPPPAARPVRIKSRRFKDKCLFHRYPSTDEGPSAALHAPFLITGTGSVDLFRQPFSVTHNPHEITIRQCPISGVINTINSYKPAGIFCHPQDNPFGALVFFIRPAAL